MASDTAGMSPTVTDGYVTYQLDGSPRGRDAPRPPLSVVVERLGPQVVTVLADTGTDGSVDELVVGGVGEPVPSGGGVVLLLPGVDVPTERTNQVLRAAASAGCTAVVVKGEAARLEELTAVAVEVGVDLLGVPADLSWRRLESLLEAARDADDAAFGASSDRDASDDVYALANAIASAVGGAITIEDVERRVVAYSNIAGQEIDRVRRDGILGRVGPEGRRPNATYRAVMDSETTVAIPWRDPDVAERLGVAVRAGSRVIGTIWAIADRPALSEDAPQVLLDAARAAALQLLRVRARRDPERHARSELLRALIDGSGLPRTANAQLGLKRGTATTLLAVRSGGDLARRRINALRLGDLVDLYVDAWNPSAVSVVESGTIYALLPLGSEGSRRRLLTLATELGRAAQRSAGVEPLVALGPRVEALRDLPEARTMVDRILTVLDRTPDDATGTGEPRVAAVEEVKAGLVLQALSEDPLVTDDLRLDRVAEIVAHDGEHDTEYAATLVAWFGRFGDVARVADDLTVHRNTVRYRLRRAQDLFGLDLDSADDLLCTWLQLRLLEDRS